MSTTRQPTVGSVRAVPRRTPPHTPRHDRARAVGRRARRARVDAARSRAPSSTSRPSPSRSASPRRSRSTTTPCACSMRAGDASTPANVEEVDGRTIVRGPRRHRRRRLRRDVEGRERRRPSDQRRVHLARRRGCPPRSIRRSSPTSLPGSAPARAVGVAAGIARWRRVRQPAPVARRDSVRGLPVAGRRRRSPDPTGPVVLAGRPRGGHGRRHRSPGRRASPAARLADALKPSVFGDVLDTTFGKVWLARVVLLAPFVLLLTQLRGGAADVVARRRRRARPRDRRHARRSPVTPTAAGGPSSRRSPTSAHVSAAAVWLGGLSALVLAALRADEREARDDRRAVLAGGVRGGGRGRASPARSSPCARSRRSTRSRRATAGCSR